MFLNYNQTSGSCSYKIDCYLKKILKIVPGVLCTFYMPIEQIQNLKQ